MRELVVCRGMLFQCGQSLGREAGHTAFMTDSSALGFAVLESKAAPREVLEACMWKEKWRFTEPHDPTAQRIATASWAAPAESSRVQCVSDDLVKDLIGAQSNVNDCTAKLPAPKKKRVVKAVNGVVPAIAPGWVVPDRWRLVLAGAWRHGAKIHQHESRVSVMALHRAASDHTLHDRIVPTFGDNLGELLAHEKGRSPDVGLNAHCRRACSLQVASGISWRRRHVETSRNVADRASRYADEGLLHAGQIISPGGRAQARDRRRADAGFKRVLQRLGVEWSLRPAFADMTPAISQQIRDHLAATAACRRTGTNDRSRPMFLEVFAGKAFLSGAVHQLGLRTGPPIEIDNGECFDIAKPSVQKVLLDWIARRQVWWIHLAIPCTRWSQARTSAAPLSADKKAMDLYQATISLISAAGRANIYISIENPWTSKLWQWDPLAKLMHDFGLTRYRTDMCVWGAPFRKVTCFATNFHQLGNSIAKTCSCTIPHIRLQGMLLQPKPGSPGRFQNVWATHFASCYPPDLCRQLAQAALASAPPGSRLSSAQQRRNHVDCCLRDLATASKCTKPPVSAPTCPRTFTCGWEECYDGVWFSCPPCRRIAGPKKGPAPHGKPRSAPRCPGQPGRSAVDKTGPDSVHDALRGASGSSNVSRRRHKVREVGRQANGARHTGQRRPPLGHIAC